MIDLNTIDFEQAYEDNLGYCVCCGAERDCVEPDACAYECDECGEPAVYGVEPLMLALQTPGTIRVFSNTGIKVYRSRFGKVELVKGGAA